MEMVDLRGRKGLVLGIANENSLASAAAQRFCNAGAELAVTYPSEKAKPFVEPLVRRLGAPIFLPCDVATADQLEAVFAAITRSWSSLDFVFHAVAWAHKDALLGLLSDCAAERLTESMLVSCHSFLHMSHLAEPLMAKGGSLVMLNLYDAEQIVDYHSIMGPIKAALEALVRYLADELGPKQIRVNAIFVRADKLLSEAIPKALLLRTVQAAEVGRAALLLASDHTAAITGEVLHVDGGFHVEGMVCH
jgi:enoyl-[acyl-carrier protein] reductase I